MFLQEMQHTIDKISSAKINNDPYTWVAIDNIFTDELYSTILKNSIPSEYLYSLKDIGRVNSAYSDGRLVTEIKPDMPMLPENIKEFWENFGIWMHYSFKKILFEKFNLSHTDIKVDCLYTRDSKGFHLRPHADTNSKIITALIYLPENSNNLDIGTSIYIPKREGFVCETGEHYPYDAFNTWKTITYEPNKLFCFVKSTNSFHGLHPIKENVERNLLIFDVKKV